MSMRLFKHLLLSVCFFFGSITFGLSQYTLTVESSIPAAAPGTVYRFYVDMVDPTDRMSAVFGNNVDALTLSAPDGVFNTSYNGSWNASGINSAFLALFPIHLILLLLMMAPNLLHLFSQPMERLCWM